jgi:ABC-type multidrug transport system ATPase subunit
MIRVRGLGFTYPGGSRPALQGLDLDVGPGEIFGILGPTGSGKTTLVRILAGILRAYRGEVSFLGKDYPAWSRDFYERIGVSLAAPALFASLSAGENLTASARLYRAGTRSAGELLGLAGLADHAKRRAGTLAAGARKRLDLARALAHRPDCLIADEPLSGLDGQEAGLARNMLMGQKRSGASVVMAASDASLIHGLCDRWIDLADGPGTATRIGKDA